MSLPRTPFLTAVPEDWSQVTESAATAEPVACRRAYAHHLIRQQWRLQQARAPRRAATLIDQAVGRGDRPPPPAARLVPALSHCAPVPVINVVCENRRWLFEDWKHALVAAGQPGFQVLVSSQPLPTAAAWIFLRAAEVARTPDPQRTGVQIHDLAGGALYRPGGARRRGRRRGAFADPSRPDRASGGKRDRRSASSLDHAAGGMARDRSVRTRGQCAPEGRMVGRPTRRDGTEISSLDPLVSAACRWARVAEVVLIGEQLGGTAMAGRRGGAVCRTLRLAQCPFTHAPAWLSSFDVIVLTSDADFGPWPIFDALHAGVPLVALPAGWAKGLLASGKCGRLAANAGELAEAVIQVIAEQSVWRRRTRLYARGVGQSFTA